jgi:cysteine synthase B
MIYQQITELIGNTPLLRIDPAIHGLKNIDLYAKLEYLNPFGSVKDRVAWGMLKDDIVSIKEKQQTILEMSSGNTAKALQGIASVYGIPFKTITNRIKVTEQKSILKILGAEIEELPGSSDCHDPYDPNDPLVFINKELKNNGDRFFFTSQYSNPKNIDTHFETTGAELLADLPRIDYLLGGLGTTGSTRGTALKIKERDSNLQTIGICATKRDYIPGIRNQDEVWEVGLFDPSFYSDIVYTSSLEAVDGMLTLCRRLGVLGGPTSGACYQGALKHLRAIDAGLTERKTAVFIVCDRLEWYASYIKERRPELFEQGVLKDSIDALTAQEVENALLLSLEESQEWMTRNHPLLIDMRGHQSFHLAHIEGSTNIPESLLKVLVEGTRPFSLSQRILLICPKGEQSKRYASYLAKKGYSAFSLEGGLNGWRERKMPLTSLVCCHE